MHRQRAVASAIGDFPDCILRPPLDEYRFSTRCSGTHRSSEMDESGTKPNFQSVSRRCGQGELNWRSLLLGGATLAGSAILPSASLQTAQAQVQMPAPSSAPKPNILVIFGDDVGIANISAAVLRRLG